MKSIIKPCLQRMYTSSRSYYLPKQVSPLNGQNTAFAAHIWHRERLWLSPFLSPQLNLTYEAKWPGKALWFDQNLVARIRAIHTGKIKSSANSRRRYQADFFCFFVTYPAMENTGYAYWLNRLYSNEQFPAICRNHIVIFMIRSRTWNLRCVPEQLVFDQISIKIRQIANSDLRQGRKACIRLPKRILFTVPHRVLNHKLKWWQINSGCLILDFILNN